MKQTSILIADIGGTNARFAQAINGSPFFAQAQTFKCSDFATADAAIETYLVEHGLTDINAMYLAVAGQVVEGQVKFTNNHWNIDESEISAKFGVPKVRLLNDFKAIAHSLPEMCSDTLTSIGGDWTPSRTNFTFGVIGPGSGLGIAGLVNNSEQLIPIVTQGGHSGFSPVSEQQAKLASILRKQHGHVSNEHVLSGPGLINIYRALSQIHGAQAVELSAAQIATQGISGKNLICHASLDLFFEILGQVAGDVSLMLGAPDGVFIAGGIAQRYPAFLAASKFRQGFENKGSNRELMQSVPTWLINHENPGLLGCSVFSQRDFFS